MSRFSLLLFLPTLIVCSPALCQQQTASVALPDSPAPHVDVAYDPGADTGVTAPNHHGYPTDREETW
ncbi:MAG TPA: hypothetical protein VJS11_04330, partial [Acidobacteriaceae bacterium]|nr:hypothetical protein [Acidobacteriaceae bacterium]